MTQLPMFDGVTGPSKVRKKSTLHSTAAQQRDWRRRNPDRVRVYNAARRDQRHEYNADWCARNPDRVYAKERRRRLKRYGLTIADYDRMFREQDGKCAMCHTVPSARKTINGRRYVQLDVDHCHTTQKVRGLLCINCNAILGQARDSIETLSAAIAYLTRARP
jgi:hypothetical protein